MSARAATMQRRSGGGGMFLLLVFATIAAGVVLGTHALGHSTAQSVRNCDERNVIVRLVDPATGRRAIICEYEPGKFGRFITEMVDGVEREVTAFADSSRVTQNTLAVAIRNIVKAGYTNIEFIRPDMMDAIVTILAGG